MSDVRFEPTTVDGEQLQAVSRDSLVDLNTAGPPAVERWLQAMVQFVTPRSEFTLARHVVRRSQAQLWLVLLKMPDGPQRVHIETLSCPQCRTKLTIANPTVSDLYIGVPDRQAALDRAWKQPAVPCPRCGKQLPRRATWAEIT